MLIKLLLSTGIIYCVACYAITLLPFTFCRGEDEEMEQAMNSFREAFWRSPSRVALTSLFILVPLFLVLIPLIIPFCAIQCYLEERKAAAELRKHRDYIFAWTNRNDLPEEVRAFFDLRTQELQELGFQLDGFYLMKPRPYDDYYGALFINKSGTTVASLTHLFGCSYFGFSSIFESGRCIDTSPTEATPDLLRFADNPRFTAVLVPGETISAGYRRHQEKQAELFWTTDDRLLAFESEQICDVLQYEGRMFSQELYELGDHDTPPPTAVLPQALPLAWEYPLFPEPNTLEGENHSTPPVACVTQQFPDDGALADADLLL